MYPQQYIDYLVYFHADRDYFECHEILEEYWKSFPIETRSAVWVGLIQIAVGLYHQRRGNLTGAEKMFAGALAILRDKQLSNLGVDREALLHDLQHRLQTLHTTPYADLNLPLTAPELVQSCKTHAKKRAVTWLAPSDFTNSFLMHKHTLRDRSHVIRTREDTIKRRQRN
nr:DUF309 domain-containing protein [Aneurinibacillus terranovensis]